MRQTQSEKLEKLMKSEIRNMSIECDKINGINLSQGICDLELPQILVESACYAIQSGENHYTRFDGINKLREEIATKATNFNGLSVDPNKNVIVSCGATGALFCTCFALLNPGDEVLLFEPYYGYHEYTLMSLDLVPVFSTLISPDWTINFQQLEQLITHKTKAIILNTPLNPCGKVFTYNELDKLADFAIKHDLFVFTDEIYEYITFDKNKHISPGSLKKIADRTVTISGYSKTFSITGWRIGYSIANEQITSLIGCANDLLYVCAPAPFQFAVACGVETLDDEFYHKICEGYAEKRDLLCDTLKKVGLIPYIPEGAYYVLADVSILPGINSKDKAMWLLENTGIGTVPGEAFYKSDAGKNLVRFCFAKSASVIRDACNILLEKSKLWRE